MTADQKPDQLVDYRGRPLPMFVLPCATCHGIPERWADCAVCASARAADDLFHSHAAPASAPGPDLTRPGPPLTGGRDLSPSWTLEGEPASRCSGSAYGTPISDIRGKAWRRAWDFLLTQLHVTKGPIVELRAKCSCGWIGRAHLVTAEEIRQAQDDLFEGLSHAWMTRIEQRAGGPHEEWVDHAARVLAEGIGEAA